MIRYLVEALFAIVFAQALVAYTRTRDPMQRDVMAIFSATAMLFVLDIARSLFGTAPTVLRAIALILLFAQPYFTVRLVHRVRPVPRWLHIAAVGGVVISAVAVLSAPKLSVPLLLLVLAIFDGVLAVAATVLCREARARTGSPRARTYTASLATATFGLGLTTASAGPLVIDRRPLLQTLGYAMLLVSAAGYLLAFAAPEFVRRMSSAAALYRISRQLWEAPSTDTPADTWAGYAHTVRAVTGADAVLVVPPDGDSDRPVATAGLRDRGVQAGEGDVSLLLGVPPRTDVAARAAVLPDFAVAYAGEVGARYLTAASLRSPLGGAGALVLLNRRTGMFAEDDLRMLGDLGAQTAIIAERGAVRHEQERLAQELAKSVGALSAASQAKSDFLASMSHELRTPLNAIIGFSELMRGEQSMDDSRLVPVEWIEHIYASGRHLLSLINDILDLAKIEAGRLELHPERVELTGLVAETVSTLRPLMESKELRLRTEIPMLDVRADRIRLRQVLDNLLSNAIKFTPEGGTLAVEACRIDGEVRISVIDTGVGIEPADQERIFEEFQQVGDVTMHQAGTGLGLALTRRLVESHGGRIDLHSTLGQGSRFTVCLPDAYPLSPAEQVPTTGVDRVDGTAPRGERPAPVAAVIMDADAAVAAAVAAADAAVAAAAAEGSVAGGLGLPAELTNGRGGDILLIEDEPSAARLLRTYLESAGYRVRLASSGEDGLAAARADRPDAVLLDVLLPGIDGWEVLRLLKQDARLREVPVFVASVVDERDVGLSLGAVDFFVKPIDRQRLLARVAEFLLRPASTGHQMHVLAVDDDPGTLEVISSALRAQDVDVVTATTGRDAVRLARSRPFDLIISDLAMPDIDGLSLMSALDHDPATSNIPVLVVTGADLSDEDRNQLDAKALGILPKGDAVHEALHHWMTRLPRPQPQTTSTTGPEASP